MGRERWLERMRRRTACGAAAVLIAALLGGPSSALPAAASGPNSAPLRPESRRSLKNDLSPALRDIQPTAPREGAPREIPVRRLPKAAGSPGAGQISAAEAGPVGGPNIPGPLVSFEGVNNVDGVLPPDPVGEVGPNHYVQWVNVSFAVYDRSGGLLYPPAAGNTLWSGFGGICESANEGDPIVQYDQLADRWLMSQFAFNVAPNGTTSNHHQCIAVSQTGDPLGAWHRYDFLVSSTKLNDYPKFGVWPDAYYLSINQFTGGTTWAGAGALAFEREKMLVGLPAQMVYFDLFSVNPNFGGMLPSDADGFTPPPAAAPNYFAEVDDSTWIPPSDALRIWEFHVDWADPAASTFGVSGQPNATITVSAFDPGFCGSGPFATTNCVPQPPAPGPDRFLDTLGDRLMYRLGYRKIGANESLVVNHTVEADPAGNAFRAGVRWYELRKSGGAWSVFQQGTQAPADGLHRWMASAAMDGDGSIAVGYSLSSGSVFPSIRYAGRLAGDPLGSLAQGEASLVDGGGSQTHAAERWGDYSAMSVDPLDECTFWYTQEYYASTSSIGWLTRIGSFEFSPCTATSVPGPPRNVTAAGGDGSATVSWSAPAFDGRSAITSYTITASPGGVTATAGASATTATVTGLSAGAYRFTVKATNGVGTGSPSAPSSSVLVGPFVLVAESGGSTSVSEAGPTSDTYTMVLNTLPAANVTVTATPDAQVSVDPATLVFTPGNSATPQTVTVTAVNDPIAETSPHSGVVTHAAASADPNYSGIAIPGVTASIVDNDTAGVTITQGGGATNVGEGGATDTYTVVLNTQPTANVTVTATPDPQVTAAPATLVFTPANFSAPQTVTVTAVDDSVPEGSHTGVVTHSASSGDPFYNAISIASVTAAIADNDAGVLIIQSGGATSVSEAGQTSDTYTLALSAQPASNVTVTASPDVQVTAAPTTLVFTPANFSTPQAVAVTAVDDAVDEAPAHPGVVTHSAASADPNYNGIPVASVTASITDNDTAGVTVSQSSGSTDVRETLTTSDTYTVVLNSEPVAGVTIAVTFDAGQVSVAPASLTFTAANWSSPKTVTVTGKDDSADETSPHTSTLTHSAASSDPKYNGIPIASVSAKITDNDVSGYWGHAFGGVHPFDDDAPLVTSPLPTFTFRIARGLAVKPGAGGGYILDGFGGIHKFAVEGGSLPATLTGTPYFGFDIARAIVLRAQGGAYVVDGFGGIHPAGGAPATSGGPYFGFDIARAFVLTPDGKSGYILDGYGGIHPFALAGNPLPAAPAGGPYFGFDIARAIVLTPDGKGGYILDGYGGIHGFSLGVAPPGATGGPYFAGADMARGFVLLDDGSGGFVLDGKGGIHPFGTGINPPPGFPATSGYRSADDAARTIAIR